MKKFSLFLSFFLFLVSGCNNVQQKTFEYEDFDSNHIAVEDLLNIKEDKCLIYIYSTYCGHCKEIKSKVLFFLANSNVPFFLLKENSNIKKCEDATNITLEDFCIYGVPTLIYVNSGAPPSFYTGIKQIESFILDSPI